MQYSIQNLPQTQLKVAQLTPRSRLALQQSRYSINDLNSQLMPQSPIYKNASQNKRKQVISEIVNIKKQNQKANKSTLISTTHNEQDQLKSPQILKEYQQKARQLMRMKQQRRQNVVLNLQSIRQDEQSYHEVKKNKQLQKDEKFLLMKEAQKIDILKNSMIKEQIMVAKRSKINKVWEEQKQHKAQKIRIKDQQTRKRLQQNENAIKQWKHQRQLQYQNAQQAINHHKDTIEKQIQIKKAKIQEKDQKRDERIQQIQQKKFKEIAEKKIMEESRYESVTRKNKIFQDLHRSRFQQKQRKMQEKLSHIRKQQLIQKQQIKIQSEMKNARTNNVLRSKSIQQQQKLNQLLQKQRQKEKKLQHFKQQKKQQSLQRYKKFQQIQEERQRIKQKNDSIQISRTLQKKTKVAEKDQLHSQLIGKTKAQLRQKYQQQAKFKTLRMQSVQRSRQRLENMKNSQLLQKMQKKVNQSQIFQQSKKQVKAQRYKTLNEIENKKLEFKERLQNIRNSQAKSNSIEGVTLSRIRSGQLSRFRQNNNYYMPPLSKASAVPSQFRQTKKAKTKASQQLSIVQIAKQRVQAKRKKYLNAKTEKQNIPIMKKVDKNNTSNIQDKGQQKVSLLIKQQQRELNCYVDSLKANLASIENKLTVSSGIQKEILSKHYQKEKVNFNLRINKLKNSQKDALGKLKKFYGMKSS